MPNFRVWMLVAGIWLFTVQNAFTQTVLNNAFAHNDYKHKRPLFDALNWGVANIEADIFLYKNKLVVAHFIPFFRKNRTLEKLYFKPLLDRFTLNNDIYSGYKEPIVLMIDIKSDPDKTYLKLKELLLKYQAILTSYDNGVITPRAVTVVISGNKPYKLMAGETSRLAFIDDDLKNGQISNKSSDLCLMASSKFSRITSWSGKRPMSVDERNKLCGYIRKAHEEGKKVRLWAIPQNQDAWTTLINCGVDLINSDNLQGMSAYFANKKSITNYSYQVNK
jgi:hypothetical protein